MDAEDRELFERSLLGATERHSGAALDAALVEVGWRDALATDPRAAVSILFELQGRAGATSSALDQVLAGAAGITGDPAPAVVLPAAGRTDPPGAVDGSRLTVDGLAAATGATGGGAVVVVARSTGGDVAVTVPTSALTATTVAGIDPAMGLVSLTGEVDAAGTVDVDWDAAVTAGQVALGHELVGASRRMLELARTHALERIQFGRPIAMFQAVRHRLADTLVAVETADAMLDAAWLDGTPLTAAMAKASAGRAARTTGRHCQQVLAGIGFTTEHDLHRYVRRTLLLDQLLGSTRALTRALGRDLARSRTLPPLLPL